MERFVETIKQHPGAVQVTRAVKVDVPGKHFPTLQTAEQKQMYSGTAVEYSERHQFDRHLKAWGAAHRGPGIRFVCESDAIDDPDHKGFWTTLALWNRWRHDTYKDNPDAELQFLDELPKPAPAPAADAVKKEKSPPEVKSHFTVVSSVYQLCVSILSNRSPRLSGAIPYSIYCPLHLLKVAKPSCTATFSTAEGLLSILLLL